MFVYYLPPSYIVWFDNTNQWVQLDNKQHFVFGLYNEGLTAQNAVECIIKQYGSGIENHTEFIDNLYQSFDILNARDFSPPDFSTDSGKALKWTLDNPITFCYQYQDVKFSIRYGSRKLKAYIHPGFHHLKIDSHGSSEPLFEVFPMDDRWALRINGSEVYTCDESPHLKKLLYVELSKYLYRIPEKGWMARIHASAVYRGERLILIASPSGSGKSTLTALLMNRGYQFFADDFIPVCIEEKLLYPFPAALCIKESSFHVMQQEGIRLHLRNSFAGYLIGNEPMEKINPLHAREMIFVRYVPDVELSLSSMKPTDALKIFMDESWVSNHYEGAKAFIEWFSGLKFYSLQYSNNEEVLSVIDDLIAAIKN